MELEEFLDSPGEDFDVEEPDLSDIIMGISEETVVVVIRRITRMTRTKIYSDHHRISYHVLNPLNIWIKFFDLLSIKRVLLREIYVI